MGYLARFNGGPGADLRTYLGDALLGGHRRGEKRDVWGLERGCGWDEAVGIREVVEVNGVLCTCRRSDTRFSTVDMLRVGP